MNRGKKRLQPGGNLDNERLVLWQQVGRKRGEIGEGFQGELGLWSQPEWVSQRASAFPSVVILAAEGDTSQRSPDRGVTASLQAVVRSCSLLIS